MVLVGKEPLLQHDQNSPKKRRRQPVKQRQGRVEFDRKPTVRCRYKDALAGNPPELVNKQRLIFATTDMLHHCTRMNKIERAVGKRQSTAIGSDDDDAG